MLRCKNHIGRAEQRIRSCREYADRALLISEHEINLRADRPADPILLHLQRAGRPINELEVLE